MNEFIIDELRRKQNERLLEVLEEEQKAEQVCAWMCRCVGLCMGAGPPLPPLHVYVHYVYVYYMWGTPMSSLFSRPCLNPTLSHTRTHKHPPNHTHTQTRTHAGASNDTEKTAG